MLFSLWEFYARLEWNARVREEIRAFTEECVRSKGNTRIHRTMRAFSQIQKEVDKNTIRSFTDGIHYFL